MVARNGEYEDGFPKLERELPSMPSLPPSATWEDVARGYGTFAASQGQQWPRLVDAVHWLYFLSIGFRTSLDNIQGAITRIEKKLEIGGEIDVRQEMRAREMSQPFFDLLAKKIAHSVAPPIAAEVRSERDGGAGNISAHSIEQIVAKAVDIREITKELGVLQARAERRRTIRDKVVENVMSWAVIGVLAFMAAWFLQELRHPTSAPAPAIIAPAHS